jgi:mRNA-degrading endonuclease RelE of RelBE toxin-antitoxin system
MNPFSRLPEFEKEFQRLADKYRSLPKDLARLEGILVRSPTGVGANFTILYRSPTVSVVKMRLSCESLRKRALRLIYAYREDTKTVTFIELYYKGSKENEDRDRIKAYLKEVGRS